MTGVNVASITEAIKDLLDDDQDFQQVTVCRAEPLNDDPANCPWIGIYRREHRYTPRTLGKGSGHRQFIGDIVIAAQDTSLSDGADCEDLVDLLVTNVIDAVFNDPKLRESCDMTNDVLVTYSYDAAADDEHEQYFQTAFIQLTVETTS
jgi:hypothetical protein